MSAAQTIYVDDLIDRQRLTTRSYFILGLLLLALLCDGFDLQLLAFAAPRLAREWNIDTKELGLVSSANLLGMMFGAMFLGRLGDHFGRKRVIVVGTVLYACMSLACLLAHTPLQLGVLRFITGLGLGGVLPNVIALSAEISPSSRRAMLTSIPMIGMSLGSGMPAVVAGWLVPIFGWKALFVAGGIVPLVVATLIAAKLPESVLFLTFRRQRRDEVARRARELDPTLVTTPETVFALRGSGATTQRGSVGDLFAGSLRMTTPLLWIIFACTLLSMHFINSWISYILNEAGLSEGQTALTNGMLHWGGTVAAIATVILLRRLGLYLAMILLLLGLAGCFTIATTGFSSAPLLIGAVSVAGFGIIGCQGVLNASAGLIYPVSCRPTGVGAALGVGRIGSLSGPVIGGFVVAQNWPTQQIFFVPMLPLGVAAIATLILLVRHVSIRGEAGGAH
jgi:AAHS family 4-hydroxybenzoate transporter-like MFS transporter